MPCLLTTELGSSAREAYQQDSAVLRRRRRGEPAYQVLGEAARVGQCRAAVASDCRHPCVRDALAVPVSVIVLLPCAVRLALQR